MHAFDVRHDGTGWQRNRFQILNHRGLNRFRHVATQPVEGHDTPVGVLRLIEPRHISIRQAFGQFRQRSLALTLATFALQIAFALASRTAQFKAKYRRSPARPVRHRPSRTHRQTRPSFPDSACTDHRQYQRIRHRPRMPAQRNATQIQHRQDVGADDISYCSENPITSNSSVACKFPSYTGEPGTGATRLPCPPRCECAFGQPVRSAVHQRIKHLQTMMALPMV